MNRVDLNIIRLLFSSVSYKYYRLNGTGKEVPQFFSIHKAENSAEVYFHERRTE